MTLSMRNAILLAGTAMSLIIIGAFCYATLVIAPGDLWPWLLSAYRYDLTVLFLLQLTALCSALALYGKFRKTASPEIFFFLLFLLSLTGEGMRILPLVLRQLHTPVYLDQMAIRSIYMARIFGALSIFSAGLFSNGMQYQKLSIAFGITLLASFTLASLLPVTDAPRGAGDGVGLFALRDVLLVVWTLETLSIFNFAAAWLRNSDSGYLWLAFAAALVVGGSELIARAQLPALRLAAFALLIWGTLLFSRRTHEIYLWI